MFEWLLDPSAWMALATLTLLEIVLGIDNIIFISILVGRMPKEQQPKTRIFGLALAMGTRILLLTDGARRNDPLYDQALLGNESPVEIDWVKRLEFVSGPASAIYGANALFGTANAVMLEGGDIDGTRITLDGGTSATRRLNVMAGQRLEAHLTGESRARS